jgi:ribonuclease HII
MQSEENNVSKKTPMLRRFYDEKNNYEICIDEAGRGCLFGRVYIASVVLPKDPDSFSCKDIKDSKKFSSKKKIKQVADYIKSNALAWNISYIEHDVIDDINILKAVMRGMHECIRKSLVDLEGKVGGGVGAKGAPTMAIIDGNYFTPYCHFDTSTETIVELPHVTIEKGDSLYVGIAAASILAKTARDDYILEMCETHPELATIYGLDTNMGYGTKKHMDAIKEHGITDWHRRSFAPCRIGAIVHSV